MDEEDMIYRVTAAFTSTIKVVVQARSIEEVRKVKT
jgi:hypothetical protein